MIQDIDLEAGMQMVQEFAQKMDEPLEDVVMSCRCRFTDHCGPVQLQGCQTEHCLVRQILRAGHHCLNLMRGGCL